MQPQEVGVKKNLKMRLSSLLNLCLQSDCKFESAEKLVLLPQFGKDSFVMLHFSCDLCGHRLGDRRFVAKLETYPAFDPDAFEEDDLDADHLQELSEIIEHMEETGETGIEQCSTKTFRFDLCPECHEKFLKDPLGRDSLQRLDFSEN